MATILAVLSLAGMTVAQSSTAYLFLPYADPQSLVASIAGNDATATTYVVNCPSAAATTSAGAASASATDFADIGDDDCGFPEAVTVTQGPSTVHYSITAPGAADVFDCKLTGTTEAFCTVSASGAALTGNSDIPPVTSGTLSGSEVSFMPVIVTAGSVNAKATGTGSNTGKTTGSSTPKSTGTTAAGAAKTGTTSSAQTQSTNAAVQGSPVVGAGIMGALGVAVAGVML